MQITATYDPADNKCRMRASERLPKELYERVRAAGFIWAPKQELFVAPMWTPSREDLMIELCGEIGDEDTSLVDRAEERAERFEDYHDSRTADAHQAKAAVDRIANGIPLGQPILVGHHSERHARKDAEKIRNGMAKAVKMWETAQYWKDRAAGAIRHAKYKERPDVRHRRIKGLEAENRKLIAEYTPKDNHVIMQTAWGRDAEGKIPHVWCGAGRGGRWVPADRLEAIKASNARWIAHNNFRIEYERAMLQEAGGIVAEKVTMEIGGRVLVRGEWVTITKLNKKNGEVVSVTTNARYCRVRSVEQIQEYEPPSQEQAAAAQAATKIPPLCNYPSPRFATCTQAEWDAIPKDWRGMMHYVEATDTADRHRVRHAMGFKVHMPPPEGKELDPRYCSSNRTHTFWPVFITDAKRKDPPGPTTEKPPTIEPPRREITQQVATYSRPGCSPALRSLTSLSSCPTCPNCRYRK